MLNDIISTMGKITIILGDKRIPANDIKPEFLKLIDNSYFAPSYIIADNLTLKNFKKEICLEFEYSGLKEFKGNAFEKLFLVVKPKYNWLTFYRYFAGEYQGKCLNLNLNQKTTNFYRFLKKYIGEKNEN